MLLMWTRNVWKWTFEPGPSVQLFLGGDTVSKGPVSMSILGPDHLSHRQFPQFAVRRRLEGRDSKNKRSQTFYFAFCPTFLVASQRSEVSFTKCQAAPANSLQICLCAWGPLDRVIDEHSRYLSIFFLIWPASPFWPIDFFFIIQYLGSFSRWRENK